jgi:methyl-accepting chemotaxis protein
VENLIQDLQKTIQALETLSESPATRDDAIDELLDQLFQQKIDLVNANPSGASAPCQQAAQAMKQAAGKAERAAKEPGRVKEMMPAVSEAIAKLAKLLDHVAPIA